MIELKPYMQRKGTKRDDVFGDYVRAIEVEMPKLTPDEQHIVHTWIAKLSEPTETEAQKTLRNAYAQILLDMIKKNNRLGDPFTDSPPKELKELKEFTPMKDAVDPSDYKDDTQIKEPSPTRSPPRGFSPGRGGSPQKSPSPRKIEPAEEKGSEEANKYDSSPEYAKKGGSPRTPSPGYEAKGGSPKEHSPGYEAKGGSPKEHSPGYEAKGGSPKEHSPGYEGKGGSSRERSPGYGGKGASPREYSPRYGEKEESFEEGSPNYGRRGGSPREYSPRLGEKEESLEEGSPGYGKGGSPGPGYGGGGSAGAGGGGGSREPSKGGSREPSPSKGESKGSKDKPKFNYVRLPCAKRPGEGTGAIPKAVKTNSYIPEYFDSNLHNEFEDPEEMAKVIARSKGQSFAEFIVAISRHTADFGQELRNCMKAETSNFREYVDHVLSQRIKDLTEVLNEEQNAELRKIKKDIDKWQLELSHCKKRIKEIVPNFDINLYRKDKNYLKRIFTIDFTAALPQDESAKLWKDETRIRLSWYGESTAKMSRCNDRLSQQLEEIKCKITDLKAQASLQSQKYMQFMKSAIFECQKLKEKKDQLTKENSSILAKIQDFGA